MIKPSIAAIVIVLARVFDGSALAQEPKAGGVIHAVIQPEPVGLMIAINQNGPAQNSGWQYL